MNWTAGCLSFTPYFNGKDLYGSGAERIHHTHSGLNQVLDQRADDFLHTAVRHAGKRPKPQAE